jgi:hypothetical protein
VKFCTKPVIKVATDQIATPAAIIFFLIHLSANIPKGTENVAWIIMNTVPIKPSSKSLSPKSAFRKLNKGKTTCRSK